MAPPKHTHEKCLERKAAAAEDYVHHHHHHHEGLGIQAALSHEIEIPGSYGITYNLPRSLGGGVVGTGDMKAIVYFHKVDEQGMVPAADEGFEMEVKHRLSDPHSFYATRKMSEDFVEHFGLQAAPDRKVVYYTIPGNKNHFGLRVIN